MTCVNIFSHLKNETGGSVIISKNIYDNMHICRKYLFCKTSDAKINLI